MSELTVITDSHTTTLTLADRSKTGPLAARAISTTRQLRSKRCTGGESGGRTARELFPCTHPLTPSTRLDKPQAPFFKSLVMTWPGIESSLPTFVRLTCFLQNPFAFLRFRGLYRRTK